jgi:hypothetical protein
MVGLKVFTTPGLPVSGVVSLSSKVGQLTGKPVVASRCDDGLIIPGKFISLGDAIKIGAVFKVEIVYMGSSPPQK